ncbi:MAG: hypothetical protein WD534_00035 [Phycisphaeraceae bacterium]
MDPRTFQFVVFCLFSVLCLAGGYALRRKGVVHEDASRPVHFFTVSIIWSAVGLLSLWKLPPAVENLWLLLLEPLLVVVPALLAVPIGWLIGCTPRQIGVLAVAAGVGNLGFTLGGYLCYTLLSDPALLDGGRTDATPQQVGDAALAYAIAQVTIMSTVAIVMLYPIARHFGDIDSTGESLLTLIRRSLVDWRALPALTAVVGAVFAYTHVPYPAVFDRIHLIDILFYLGALGGYAGIGLRLHLGGPWRGVRQHVALAVLKFAIIPLVTLGLLALATLTPWSPPPLMRSVMLVEAFVPTAIQTVIIANLFHLDPRWASRLWLVNTLAFLVLPLPVMLWVLG